MDHGGVVVLVVMFFFGCVCVVFSEIPFDASASLSEREVVPQTQKNVADVMAHGHDRHRRLTLLAAAIIIWNNHIAEADAYGHGQNISTGDCGRVQSDVIGSSRG